MRPPPLPPRDGLGPARLRMRGGPLGEELTSRFGRSVAAKAPAGEVVDQHGVVLDPATVLPAGATVYLYRELPDEVPVPFDIPVLHRDENLVVADKPHFLATMPRGRHVAQTALVRLRRELGLPELSPAHRLDRLTAGVLVFTTRRELRGAYQTLPIVIGGSGERRTLRTAARFAQHWNFVGGTPEEFARKRDVLHAHCRDIGRDPAEIVLSSHVRLGPNGETGPAVHTAAALGDLGLDLAIVTLMPPHDPAVLAPLADALAQLR